MSDPFPFIFQYLYIHGQTLNSLIVQAEVQDGVHHAGHGLTCAGTDGDQQRVLVVAEGLAGELLAALDVLEDVSGDLVVDLAAVCVVLGLSLIHIFKDIIVSIPLLLIVGISSVGVIIHPF